MTLLEREPFLKDLGGFLQEAVSGQGRLLFLGGEAGAGKTALVRSFCRSLQTAARVLTGGCDPLSTPRPLEPLLDIAAALGGDLLRLLERPDGRGHAFRAFLGMLTRPARPTVVVFEDVHWADEATLDLLRFLGRRVEGTRALLIATYRDDEVGAAHPLRAVLGDLATSPAVARLALPPLSPGAVAVLASGTGVDAAELYRKTGGNPFFVTEVLAADGAGVPATVRDAILARAARLPPEGRELLGVAAVLGARVEPWLLEAVYGPGDAALEACLACGVLQAREGRYAFRHELAREALLESLPPQRRLALHRKVLEALRSAPAHPDDVARLAHHAEAAQDVAAVLQYAPAAARRAVALSAHREAAAQYARALRAADGLPASERAALLEAYAQEASIADLGGEATLALQEALELRKREGHPLKEGETLTLLARQLVGMGRNAEAEAASRKSLERLEALPPGLELALAYWYQAHLRMLNRDNADAVGWGQKAIDLATRLGSTPRLVSAYNTVGAATLLMGDARGRDYLERSRDMALAAGLAEQVALAYGNLGSGLGELYEFAEADAYLEAGVAYCAEHDIDVHRLYMLSWQALSHLYQGRWRAAADTALAVIRRPGVAVISRIMALVALGRVRTRRGDPEAWVALDEALALAAQTGTLQRLAPVRAARAEAAWLAGDREKTLEEARTAYDLALEKRHLWFTGELAYWRWKVGDLREAPEEAAKPFALQIAGDWAGAAAAWRLLGCTFEAARALAESEDEAALRQALVDFGALGARPSAAAVAKKLRELGVRGVPRGPRPQTRANPAGLTLRELEIVQLLAAGLRDTEIAERLWLSKKTVGHHVSAVLAKLNVRGRGDVARETQRLGILQPGELEEPR